EQRWQALVGGDYDHLERLFSDDMTYIHSNGMRDTKESYLAGLRKGTFRYTNVDRADTEVRDFGATQTFSGRAVATTESASGEMVTPLLYTAVWALVDGEWRFAAWHSCPDRS
ncbi:MAG: nuclear transport factor 2 family protein, partial [Acidimicrobiia bacterium]